MTEATTLAHLSDVHLAPLRGFHPRHWNVKRGLGYLNWHSRRKRIHRRAIVDRLVADLRTLAPDHVAVTGDLINIGLPGEYEAALRWLQELGTPDYVTVVPGNHDIYVHLRTDPGVKRWSAYMASDAWGAQVCGHYDSGFPFVRRVGPVALIGLNSAVPTPPFVAAGRLGTQQISALGPLLDRIKAEGLIRVVLIHHPPVVGQAAPRRALRDAALLEQVLFAHAPELVLHGHNHRDMVSWRPGPNGHVLIVGIASGSAGRPHKREPLARYNLLRISHDGGAPRMELRARGLLDPEGPVVDVDRQIFNLGPTQSAIQV